MKEKIKLVIPEPGIEFLKSSSKKIQKITFNFVVKSRFLSSLYYVLRSNKFSRENQGVIYGQLKYYEALQSILESQYLLRRNIHRLETGILMKNRRDVFALDYIEETVKCYEYAVLGKEQDISDSDELQWAHDVLENYFNIVTSHPIIDKAKSSFLAISSKSQNDQKRIPYQR